MTNRELDALMNKVLDGENPGVISPMSHKLSDLKKDLQALNDVPDCQYSVERLRAAILRDAQAVRPAKKGLWAWVPGLCASAAAAFGVWFMMSSGENLRTAENIATVAMKPTVEVLNSVGLSIEDSPSGKTLGSTINSRLKKLADKVVATDPMGMLGASTSVTKNPRDRRGSYVASRSRNPRAKKDLTASAMAVSSELTEPSVMPSGPGIPVVVVNEGRDPETGASAAKEVTSSDDVVFGG